MSQLLDKIHEYLRTLGANDEDLESFDSTTVGLAHEIALYAHRNQFRPNGESFINHPVSCMQAYRRLVGITPSDPFCISTDLLMEYGVPYNGVQESCLMHDVLEDTEITIDEITEVFSEFGLDSYFNLYIKNTLIADTRKEGENYDEYIDRVLQNPVASMVKMCDLSSNMNMMSLSSVKDEDVERMAKYTRSFKRINDKYHFLENTMSYFVEFQKRKTEQEG